MAVKVNAVYKIITCSNGFVLRSDWFRQIQALEVKLPKRALDIAILKPVDMTDSGPARERLGVLLSWQLNYKIVWAHCYVVLFQEDLLSLFVARTTDFNGKSKRFDPEIFFSGN